MTYSAIVRLGPLVSAEALLDPASVRPGRKLYQRGAMTLHKDAPVLIDHEDDRVVGAVEQLWEWSEGTGGWLIARCRIDEPPPWLMKGHTKASVGYAPLGRPQLIGDWKRVHRGIVTEVSLLTPGVEPADGEAKVLLLERQASPEAGDATSRHLASGEYRLRPGESWIPSNGKPITRPGGEVISVR